MEQTKQRQNRTFDKSKLFAKPCMTKTKNPGMTGYILIDNESIHKLWLQKGKTYKCIKSDTLRTTKEPWCGVRFVDDIRKLQLTPDMFSIDPETGKNKCVIAKIQTLARIKPSYVKHNGKRIATHFYASKFKVTDILMFPWQIAKEIGDAESVVFDQKTRLMSSYQIINKYGELIEVSVSLDAANRVEFVNHFNMETYDKYIAAKYAYDGIGRLYKLLLTDNTLTDSEQFQVYGFEYRNFDDYSLVLRTDAVHIEPLYMCYKDNKLVSIKRHDSVNIKIEWWPNGVVKAIHDANAMKIEHLDTDIIRKNLTDRETGMVTKQFVHSWCLVEVMQKPMHKKFEPKSNYKTSKL